MIDALLLHEVLGPEVLLRKLLPGQMYGQLLYAAGDDATWGRGHHCYTIPLRANTSSSVALASENALDWLRQKLHRALLNTFTMGSQALSRRPSTSSVVQELERFLRRHYTFTDDTT
jgi:hypothetical protein